MLVNLKISDEDIKKCADTIRIISAEAIEKAKSGHPGIVLGIADVAFIMWSFFIKNSPENPNWVDRDRFILSAGHGSMLLYSLLHLTGFNLSLEDIKNFRQLNSKTPGHPEYGITEGVDTTTGPLGQGFANGVGMAIASKKMSSLFNGEDIKPFGNNYIYGIVGDGDIMEGISTEAASIAGHLKLGNIIYIYDDNDISIDGNTDITFTEDVSSKFKALGWHVQSVDGYNYEEIKSAIINAQEEKSKPSLIIAKTHIGYGAPTKVDSPSCHGAPLGAEELQNLKKNLGWPLDKEFYIPQKVYEIFSEIRRKKNEKYKKWQEIFLQWKEQYPDLYKKYIQFTDFKLGDEDWNEIFSKIDTSSKVATRSSSGKFLQIIAKKLPNLVGGSADLASSNKTYLKNSSSISADDFSGQNIHFGIREHSMAAIANGIALYSNFIPFVSTFLVFFDYLKPSIRLSALMKQRVIYIFTHDSFYVGEDGPTHQPIEHISNIRSIPNIMDFRPANELETVSSWKYIIENNSNTPSVLILTRQNLEQPDINIFDYDVIKKGAYIISEAQNPDKIDITIFATGSEVSLALNTKKILEVDNLSVRVVSVPSLKLFYMQPREYKDFLMPKNSEIFVIEAGVNMGWYRVLEREYHFIGIEHFGQSAPANKLAEEFGFTPDKVAKTILEKIK